MLRLTMWLILVIFFTWSFGNSSASNDCKQFITPSTIENSWQSTSYQTKTEHYNKCFKKSSPEPYQWAYFHTGEPRPTDNFHWFVVKLKKLTMVQSVSITSKRNFKNVLMHSAADIEILTANSSNLNFDKEHCNSNNSEMQSLHLNGNWVQCGTTPNASSIYPGQELSVNCKVQSNKIRFILLRKRTGQVLEKTNDVMNFINMFFVDIDATVSIEPPAPHNEGSPVTIKCKSRCESPNRVQLCLPSGQCLGARMEFRTEKLEPNHSGIYTCKTGDFHEISSAELTVLCKQFITQSTIENSWQSTSYKSTNYYKCFQKSSPEPDEWGYFQTDEPRPNDKFHWFVVKLKKLTKIHSVSIISRKENNDLMNRAANIEIWTANSSNLNFERNYCDSENSEMQLQNLNRNWVLCGKTPNASSITPAQTLTVNCTVQSNEVQFILLRKRTGQVSEKINDVMNFINMFFVEIDATVSIEPPAPHNEGSPVTIKCKSRCESPNGVQLCLPSGQCLGPRSEFRTEKLQRNHSGIYTCKTGDLHEISSAELTVLYSPINVRIFSRSSISCGDLDKSRNVEFDVISDDGNPMPNHSCTAWNSSGVQLNMLMNSLVYKSADGKLKSTWFCSNCSSVANLTVKCSTVQSIGANRTAEWNCDSPKKINIFPRSSISCGDLDKSDNVKFKVISDDGNPMPNHSCTARDSSGVQLNMLMDSEVYKSVDRKLRSTWFCSKCSSVANLTVKCSAVQSFGANRTAEWNCVSVSVLENVGISLKNPVNCSCLEEPTDTEFQLIYKYVGPVPNHICSAWNRFSKQLKMEQISIKYQTKINNNTVHSTWLCSNCTNVANLTVKCRVIQNSRSNRSVEWKSECSDCESSSSTIVTKKRYLVILVSCLCTVSVSAAIFLVIACKRQNKNQKTETGAPVSLQSTNNPNSFRLGNANSHTVISKPEATDLMASTGNTGLRELPFPSDLRECATVGNADLVTGTGTGTGTGSQRDSNVTEYSSTVGDGSPMLKN